MDMKGKGSVCFGLHCNHIFVYQVLIFVAINWTSSDPSVGADCSSHSSRNSTIRGHGGHLGALGVRSVPNVKGTNSFFIFVVVLVTTSGLIKTIFYLISNLVDGDLRTLYGT